jgi:hypothetical protein
VRPLVSQARVFLGHVVQERLQICLRVPSTPNHDAQWLAKRGKIIQRIRVGEHEIRTISHGDGAEDLRVGDGATDEFPPAESQ